MDLKTFLLIAALVSATVAGPTGSRNLECSSKCDQNRKFFYELGRKYEYAYEVETRTSLTHTHDDNEATIKVSALATLQPVSPCEYLLSLSEVTLHGSEQSGTFAAEIAKRPLRFAFHDGRVEHVCPSQEDAPWVVNFKKGILSNLQNSMPNFDETDTTVVTETDVSGKCETTYTSEKMGDTIVIERLKTPSKCSHRPQIHQKLSSLGFSFDSLVQGLPILKSKQVCTQTVSKDIIESVKCDEDHTFQPFEFRGSGANTHTTTTLKLKDIKTSSSPLLESFTTRNELLFEIPDIETEDSAMEAVETILTELDDLSENGIKKEVPALFSSLVSSLRSLTQSQIQTLFDKSRPRIRNFITDALPLVGTPASTGAFVQLILKGEVSEKEREVWISSLAFMKNPSLDMFSAIEPLLQDIKENKALLGVSSMIHNYCLNDNSCQDKQSIKTLIRNFESRLGISCRATSEEEKLNILYALKAIGNVGRFVNAEYILNRCYLEDNPMEIRVAAIDAWRRIPCNEKDLERNQFLTTFTDQTQDNEIRIASYLSLMKCPTQQLVDTLKDSLTSEGVNQVASFVWTHLTNLQESAAPEKQWVRQLIGEELLQKKFTPESLKLSRNFESSFFLKEQDLGANVESNLIFSGKSFLPRSTMLNFTIDLFGESINLFEVGGRIEGLESYIEKFFGPDGYYPEETIEAIVKNLRQKEAKEDTPVDNYLAQEEGDEPKGSYYLKLFGNELFYRNFKGIENAIPEMTFSNIFDIIMELASTGSVDFTKSYNLIDSDFTFPTIAGLPLNLKLNGKAVIGLKLDGEFSFEDLSSINIQGTLHPSAAVTVDASMTVDAFVTKSGIKMVSTVHSSTSVSGKAIISEGKLIDLAINTPEQKTEIFEMTNDIFTIENGVQISRQSPLPLYKRCLSTEALGMQLCYEHDATQHYLALPSVLRVFLVKTDSHSGYVFHYANNPGKITLLLDMPGSQTDKKWSASLVREKDKYELDLHVLYSKAKLSYLFSDQETALEAELSINELASYAAKFRMTKTIEENQLKRANGEILLGFSLSNIDIFKINSEFTYEPEMKLLDARVEYTRTTGPSFKAHFNLDRKSEDKSLSFDVTSAPFDVFVSGSLGQLSSENGATLKGTYRLFKDPPKSFTTQLHYQNDLSKETGITTGSFVVDIEDLDFKTDLNFKVTENSVSGRVMGQYSHITWDIEHSYFYLVTDQTMELKTNHKSSIPSLDWEASLEHRTFSSAEQFTLESKTKIGRQESMEKVIWNYGKDFLLEKSFVFPEGELFHIRYEIQKKSATLCTWEIDSNLFGDMKKHGKGSFQHVLSNNEFSAKLNYNSTITVRDQTTDYEFKWTVDATELQLRSETTVKVNDNNSFLTVVATKSHLKIDSNFIKPFSAEAKIEQGDEEKCFFITSTMDSTIFKVSGGFGPQNLHGTFKYKEQEIKFLARLQTGSVELEAQLSPQQRFALWGHYNPGSFDVGFETPFKGWEKQEIMFTYTYVKYISFQGQARVTFANTNRMTLTVDFKNENNLLMTSKNFGLRFTSPFEKIERIELSFKHFTSRMALNTKIEGRWNSEVMKGNLDASINDGNYNLDVSLKSPFTEDMSLSFLFGISPGRLYTTLDVAYGPQKSRILLNGNISDLNNINGSFICASPILPEITINASLKRTDTSKTLEVKGKYKREKILLLGNCETLKTKEKRTCKLALKLMTGSINVFSGSYIHEIGPENEFKTDLKLSSAIVSDQSVKGHVEGKLSLPSSAVLTGYIFGPGDFTGRLDINHKITDEKLLTEINVEQNSSKIGITLGGNINLQTKECSLHGETKSTWESLNGFKMTFQHLIQDEVRETDVVFIKKDFTFKLYHSIVASGIFNWKNILKINEIYTLRSENTKTEGFLEHITKVTWPEKIIDFRVESRYSTNELTLTSMLDTPWTSLVQVTVTHGREGPKRQTEIKTEYGDGKSFLIENEYEFNVNSKYVTITLSNKDWNLAPLRFEMKLTSGVSDKLDLTLRLNQKLITVLQLFRKADTWGANVSIKFNNNNNPISIIGKYSQTLEEKKIYIEFDGRKKYAADLTISRQDQSGKVIAILTTPCFSEKSFTSTLTYNYRDHPLHLILETNFETERYYLEILINENVFSLKTLAPSVDGNLKMKWQLNKEEKSFILDFKSPFSLVKDAFLNVNYKAQEARGINFEFKYDVHQIRLQGEISDALLDFEANTSIQGWENVEAKAEFTRSEISGMISRNNDVVTFSAKGNFEISKGEGYLRFNLPSSGFEENKIIIEYANSKSIRKVEIGANIGSEVWKFKALSEPIDASSTRLTMDIQAPKSFRKATFETILEPSSVKINGEVNEYHFESSAIATFEESKTGKIMFTFTSNIENWTLFSVEADINLSQMPYKILLEVKREQNVQTYSLVFDISKDNIDIKIKTPIKSLKNIKISVNYHFQDEKLEFSLHYVPVTDSDKFNLRGNIDFTAMIPAIKVNLAYPSRELENIELVINAEIEKKNFINFLLKIGQSSYMVSISSNLIASEGVMSATLDLDKLIDVNVNISYDLLGENRHFRVSMERDGILERFSIETKLAFNEFNCKIETPITNVRILSINGKYRKLGESYIISGTAINNDDIYQFEGKAIEMENGIEIQANFPLNQYESQIFRGIITSEKTSFKFIRGDEENEILINYLIDYKNAFIKMNTPFEQFSYLAIGARLETDLDENAANAIAYIHRNSERIELIGLYELPSLMKFNCKASITAPSSFGEYSLQIFYDLISQEKNIGFIVENEQTVIKYVIETLYAGTEHGFVKVHTPYPGYETNGFEYKFKTEDITDTEVFVTLIQNSDEISFGLQSKYSANEITFMLQTPFENYHSFGIESKVSFEDKQGKLRLNFGNYKLFVEGSLQLDDFGIHIETSAENFKIFKLSSKYEWQPLKKSILLELLYNDYKYEVNGCIVTSHRSPQINFKFISPLEFMNMFEMTGKLDFVSPSEFLEIGLKVNSIKYCLSFGYELENLQGSLKLDVVTPIPKWTSAGFNANVDLSKDKKSLYISFQRENISKTISLSGKAMDGEIDFDLQTPFDMTNNFKTRLSLSRSRRSAESRVKNEGQGEGIFASFNSLEISVTTPFEKARDVHLELINNKRGGMTFAYKRNNNEVYLNFSVERKAKEFEIKVNSEIPGWELLALSGRIDGEEILAHIMGQRNSDMVHISGSGTFSEKVGSLTITSTSSFKNYEKVTTSLEYHTKRRVFRFESRSSSSLFNIYIKFSKQLFIKVFVPNEQQNTEIEGKLSLFNGSLTIKSRFPFLRTFSLTYAVNTDSKGGTSDFKIERNGVQIFSWGSKVEGNLKNFHIMFNVTRRENHSMLHIHREEWTKFEVTFQRNEKEFKIALDGTGELPNTGTVNYTILNSFGEVPRTIDGTLEVDRSSSPRKMTLTVNCQDVKQYTFYLTYNTNISKANGDFHLRTVTPEESDAPWKEITVEWKRDTKDMTTAVVKIGSKEYTATGQIGLFQTDLVIQSKDSHLKIYVKWKIAKKGLKRDYYMKIGLEERFVMLKFKGSMQPRIFDGGDIDSGFQFSRFMQEEFHFTAKWIKEGNNVKGSGKYKYGDKSGTHTLETFERDPIQRAAIIKWEATTSTGKIVVDGKYNLSKRTIDLKITKGGKELVFIKGSLESITQPYSDNTIQFNLPYYGRGEVTVSHDFRNKLAKSFKIIGTVDSQQISYIFNWTRNKKLTVFDLKGDINSPLLGVAHVEADFDVRDFGNSKGSFIYTRNDNKHVKLEWSRKKSEKSVADKLEFDSHFEMLPKARVYLNADWSKGFEVDTGIHWNDKAVKAHLKITPKNTVATISTPFEKFGNININIDYNLKNKKTKTVTFRYNRGENVVEMDFQLKMANKKTGTLAVSLTTPFEVLRTLTFNASWKKSVFGAVYKRNDITVNFDGTAEVKTGKSSFNIRFTPPNQHPVEIAFAYDLESFVKGAGTKIKDLINVKLQINQQHIDFSVKGFRTADHVFLEINGGSSFEVLKEFYVKLDSELNLNKREGHLNVRIDDFHYNMSNTFEKLAKGFYARSQVESSLTTLPGVIIGFGRDKDSFIATIGLGEEREITLSLKGKDNFKKGFRGVINIPTRDIVDLEYSINYGFKSEDKLKITMDIKVGEGEHIKADITYSSTGVQCRLSSSWTGDHSIRVRRSISNGHFMADIGVDDYGFNIEGNYDQESLKKGFKIEGEIFGQKVFIGGFFNINSVTDSEGKLIVKTPFELLRDVGGEFKVKSSHGKFTANLDLNILYQISANAEIDFDRKLKGDIYLKFENLIYEIKCDFKPNYESRILTGVISIKTPHASFERIVIESTIDTMNSRMFDAHFAVDHPSYPYSFDVMLKLDVPVFSMDITVKYPNNNDLRIVADYSFIKYPFSLKGNSSVYSNSRRIFNSNSELSYKAIDDIHINHEINCCQNYLKGSVILEIRKDQIQGDVTVLLMDYHTFEIKINIPIHWKKALFEVSYTRGEEKHTLTLNLETGTTFRKYFLDIDSPILLKGSLNLTMYDEPTPTFKAMIQTPKGLIKFNIFFKRSLIEGVSNKRLVGEIEVASPYFVNGLNIYVELMGTPRAVDIQVKVDGEQHYDFYGKFEKTDKLYNLQVNVEAPFLEGKKGSIYVSYDRFEKFKLFIESFILDYVNNLYIDLKNDGIIFSCVSPRIPTGMVRIEGQLVMHSLPDLNFKLMFAEGSGQNTWSAQGNVNLTSSTTSKSAELKVRTPYEDYRKMEFGLNYEEGDIMRLLAFAKPFNLEGEFFYGIQSFVLNTGLELRTGNEEFAVTKAEAVVPLTKFAPEFYAYFRDVEYKAAAKAITTENGREVGFTTQNIFPPGFDVDTTVSLRTKAPYEFDIRSEIQGNNLLKFGIIFDSSFLVPFKALHEVGVWKFWPTMVFF